MGLRQSAVNAELSAGSCSKAEAGRASAKGSEPASANVHVAPGAAVGRGWTKRSSGRSAAVGRAPKQVSSTLNQSRFPADRLGDEAVVGWHLVTTLFSLRLRVAQHFPYRLAAET